MTNSTAAFDLTIQALPVDARYVAETGQDILAEFQEARPVTIGRVLPCRRWRFVDGAQNSKLQRVTSRDAKTPA